MKRTGYTLKIENPCKEDWNLMRTWEAGKFCAHCQHQVIDFSQRLKDEAGVEMINKISSSVCGIEPGAISILRLQNKVFILSSDFQIFWLR